MKNKSVDQTLARPIPHLYQSFPMQEYVNDGGLGVGIWAFLRRLMRSSRKRLGHQASVMQNLRSNCKIGPPHHSRFPARLGRKDINNNLKPANVMSCQELSEQNEAADDECQEYEKKIRYPNMLPKSFDNLSTNINQIWKKPMNLGDKECIKKICRENLKIQARAEFEDQRGDYKEDRFPVVEVTQYPTWLANIVPVTKKDGNIRICVDFRDLNKASPKDNFPLPNIHILIDNCAKHEI
ncbi:hypothetical protein KY285_021078 [Solanum tuberosum]|nr:hypothetical protein KY285_021078 [Solanum tuberosum]